MMMETVRDFLTVQRIRSDRLGWAQEKMLALTYHDASTVESVSQKRRTNAGATRGSTSMDIRDQEYLIARLRETADALNSNRVNNTPVSLQGLTELLQFAQASGAVQNRKVKLYVDLVKLIESGEKALWLELAESAEYIKKALAAEDAHEFFMLLLNVATRYVNEGSRYEYLHLAQTIDRLGMLSHKGRIHQPPFVNTAVTAIQAGQFEWAEDFIKRYRPRLSGERAAEIYSEVMAISYFHQYWKLGSREALDRAHDRLLEAQSVIHGDVFETYTGRKYLAMIYFERNEHTAASGLVRTTIRALNHHKRELGSKHSYMIKFFRVAERLLELPQHAPSVSSKMATTELKMLEAAHWFSGKDWLAEKLRQAARKGTALLRAD
jgi:hypothetical protein